MSDAPWFSRRRSHFTMILPACADAGRRSSHVPALAKREEYGVVSVEHLRAGRPCFVLFHHICANVVVIEPLHRRPHRNRQFRRGESEIVDRNGICLLRRECTEPSIAPTTDLEATNDHGDWRNRAATMAEVAH